MVALTDLIPKGRFTPKETLVFIHTGGIPVLFVYNKEYISERGRYRRKARVKKLT